MERRRELFKQCVLGVAYGMEAQSLAQRIGQPEIVARDLLRAHRETYRTFWKWSDAAVDTAMLHGSLHSVFGWRLHIGEKVNPRALRNYPMQANGAEMLRIACCLATERGIEVCAPVHDAVLICAGLDQLEADISRHAGRHGRGIARRSRWLRAQHRCAPGALSRSIHGRARGENVGPGLQLGATGVGRRRTGGYVGMTDDDKAIDLEKYALSDGPTPERPASVPRKIMRRRRHFVQVPWTWVDRLKGAQGSTYRVALILLYLDWKGNGEPIKLANGMLRIDGVSCYSKWRALNELERRGMIVVERRRHRLADPDAVANSGVRKPAQHHQRVQFGWPQGDRVQGHASAKPSAFHDGESRWNRYVCAGRSHRQLTCNHSPVQILGPPHPGRENNSAE